ncbi:MAG: hypothetical protein EOP47_16695 [Sphingobacteriaceae bacterium]|nr:MAG: hypothetical protein EOP47_16695 [Sphingobacteriaceae bacterium]
MKNTILMFVLFAVVVSSCKKNGVSNPDSNKELRDIKFSTSGFTQQNSTLGTNSLRTNAVLDGAENGSTVKVLRYIVYDDQKKLIKQIQQKATDSGFGTISDKLPVGKYMVYFVGGYNYYSNPDSEGEVVPLTLEVGYDKQPYATFFEYRSFESGLLKDMFVKTVPLTVGKNDVNQSVILQRVNGQLDINILDVLPANITSINVRADNPFLRYNLDDQKPIIGSTTYYSGVNFTITPAVRGTSDNHLVMPILNTVSPFNITIRAYSGERQVSFKTIPNVECRVNKRTILRGNLFGGSGTGTGSGTVSADSIWNGTPIVKTF